MSSIFAILLIFLFIAVIGGIVVLQIFLSKRENKWFGLILPAISLFFSILMVLGIITLTAMYTEDITVMENGEIIEQTEIRNAGSSYDILSLILQTVFTFLMSNIPTVILIGIYFACREKLRRDKQMEKMNIQDLE